MPEELNVQSLEGALGAAFGGEAPERPAAVSRRPVEPEPVEAAPEEPEAPEADAVEEGDAEGLEESAALVENEPEFEVEVDGKPELVRGRDRVKELIQKGLHYGRGSEENARVREALTAQWQAQQAAAQFQGQIVTDVAELKSIDASLEQYNKIDWNAAFDADAFNALKLKEQRDQLRERRAAKVQELNQKQQQFSASQAEAASRAIAAEEQALLAKLPEWRNSEKAQSEKTALVGFLKSRGFADAEIGGLTDHRHVLLVREAYLYRQLQANKAQKVNQVRTAPPVARPGVAVPASEKASTAFKKNVEVFRKAGRQGNHRAQEQSLTQMLNKAFKL